MYNRTYGWVQNPSDFIKLKQVVQIFDSNSSHYQKLKTELIKKYIAFETLKTSFQQKFDKNIDEFTYTELVGTSKDINGKSPKQRTDAVADGLIQITIKPQSASTKGKMWTDNWTSDGYLRWALSLNFVEHNRDTDICKITPLGLKFSQSDNDSEYEKKLLQRALLSYPPATQVLRILEEAKKPVTKFYIGDKLGFKGEKGFTSYGDKTMKEWFCSASEKDQKKIRSDIEGTSDKYARMIANWLYKVGYIKKHNKKVKTTLGEKSGFQEYSITGPGKHALKKCNGSSSNKKITKYITWEFLATDCPDKDYIRTRRAYILKFLKKSKSFSVLQKKLQEYGFNDNKAVIINDIKGLNTIGIRIDLHGNTIELKDNIFDFTIPKLSVTKNLKHTILTQKKQNIMANTNIPSKYYELIEIAYTGSRNRDFEILTIDLFTNIYGFYGKLLGGPRKPDGVIFTENYGVIIDTKAYSKGYSKNITQEDEMVRYIEDNQQRDPSRNSNEWWKFFQKTIPSDSYYFMWISSEFKETFHSQLHSTSNRTGVKGAAMNVEQLLYGADKVYKGNLNLSDFQKYISNNEIFW